MARKDFQTFFPRFGNRLLTEDEKLRYAAQKDPDLRHGVDIQMLSKWLVNIPSMKNLNVNQASEIAKRMRWLKAAPHQFIFRQGDVGDACYVIVSGEVDIVVNNERVGVLSKSMNFGEVALEVEGAKRTADICANEKGAELLMIRAEDYHKNVFRYQTRRRKDITKWLRSEVSVFRDFSDNKLRYFESVSLDLHLQPGSTLYHEGDEIGAVYFVKSGMYRVAMCYTIWVDIRLKISRVCILGEVHYV